MTDARASLFADAASEAREAAKAFPRLGRMLSDFASKFERAERQRQALQRLADYGRISVPCDDRNCVECQTATIARDALRG